MAARITFSAAEVRRSVCIVLRALQAHAFADWGRRGVERDIICGRSRPLRPRHKHTPPESKKSHARARARARPRVRKGPAAVAKNAAGVQR